MRLRIATYNLESFGGDQSEELLDRRIEVLRPALEALRADVLCLQEVNAERRHKHGPRELGALETLFERTEYADFERVCTSREGDGPHDVHNLVVASRYPIVARAQHLHDAVKPVSSELVRGVAPAEALSIGWDRAALEVEIALPDGQRFFVIDLHLRAPIAAAIAGQKVSRSSWRSTQGWAEGFFASAVKRAGQALEVRLRVDRIFDEDPDALVIVAGDMNADPEESAPRIICAAEHDTGNRALAARELVHLADRIERDRRFTSRYRGRNCQPDHILGSTNVARSLVDVAIANDDLADGWEAGLDEQPILGSLHAPLVVELDLAKARPSTQG